MDRAWKGVAFTDLSPTNQRGHWYLHNSFSCILPHNLLENLSKLRITILK